MLFELGFKLQNTSNQPRVIYMELYAESSADQTDHFVDAFVSNNLAHGHDVVRML